MAYDHSKLLDTNNWKW